MQDAISMHERSSIIARLAERGRWRGMTQRAVVDIARLKTESGLDISYSVSIAGHSLVRARARNLADAVEDINDMIRANTHSALQSARVANDPTRPGMAPLARKHARSGGEDGGDWLPYKDA
jgi:hypothetical protein